MKRTCLLFWIIVAAWLPAFSVAASQTEDEPLAAVLVIDTSGSMNRSDPDGISREAGCLFLDMLDRAGSKAAVILFSDQISLETDLCDLGEGKNAGKLKNELRNARILGDTDIGGALECAVGKLAGLGSGWRRTVVLFTDGKTDLPAAADPEAAAEESEKKFEQAALTAKENNVGISCVRLFEPGQEEEDPGRLEETARATGGGFYAASGKEQIPDIFTSIFAGLVDSQTRPVTDLEIGEDGKGSFDVTIPSDRVLSADIIMLTSEGIGHVTVTDPEGEIKQQSSDTRIIREAAYSLIRLLRPAAGVWHFEPEGPGGCEVHVRLLVESDLILDALVLEDEEGNAKIRAWLSRGEELLDPERQNEFSFTAHITDVSGKNGGGDKELPMSLEDGEQCVTAACYPGAELEIQVRAQSGDISRSSPKVTFTSSRSDDIIVNEFRGTLSVGGFRPGSKTARADLYEYFRSWDGSDLSFEVTTDPGKYEGMVTLSPPDKARELQVRNSRPARFTVTVSASDAYGNSAQILIPVECNVGAWRLARQAAWASLAAAALGALLVIYLRKSPLKGRLSLKAAGNSPAAEGSFEVSLEGAGRRSSFLKLFPVLSDTLPGLKKVSVCPMPEGIRLRSGGGALLYDCYGDLRTSLRLQGGDTFEIICSQGGVQGKQIQLSGVYDAGGEIKNEDS